MKNILASILKSRIVIGLMQIIIGYFGWSMTAVTIVNSSFNTIGLIVILFSIFLYDIVKGIFWISEKIEN